MATQTLPAALDLRLGRWPETEAFVDGKIASALEGNPFAAEPGGADGPRDEHPVQGLGGSPGHRRVAPAWRGPWRAWAMPGRPRPTRSGSPVFAHEGGMFPGIAVVPGAGAEVREVAIKVESVARVLPGP